MNAAASWASILWQRAIEVAQAIPRGHLICVTIAMAAGFVADHYGGPVLLYALLFGMVLNFLAEDARAKVGIEFSARTILRVGVALLGARITIEQVASLGFGPVALVAASVSATILFGYFAGKLLRLDRDLGLLSGGATAICGVSAAVALYAVMPRGKTGERNLILTVVGVAVLSTVAMVLYPIFAMLLSLTNTEAGIFLGATIHDVAQVMGAGYMISPETGETSTVVKLMRVALLVPIVLAFGMFYRSKPTELASARPPLLPGFLIAFVLLVGINSAGLVPANVATLASNISRWCLIVAIAALGLKTSLRELMAFGFRPVLLLVTEALFLMALVLYILLFWDY